VTLTIAGDGPERPALERLAIQAGVARRVRFVGEQLGPAKEALLAEADALALPSRVLPDGRTDSAPVVLLEAMAAGLPVVATRVGGNEELIRHEHNGLLVPPHRLGPLGRALSRLAGDAKLRRSLREAGLRTAADHTWDCVGPRFERLLREL
jgi:glycosyltransferase involved in cell wall biosynthesis